MRTHPNALLDRSFLRELEALRRRLVLRAASGAVGERACRRKGGSAEFVEHRAYTPGDDPRRIDWRVFARTDEPFIKLFKQEEDAVVRLLVDASASMGTGNPEKLLTAKKLAASIAYMVLLRLERASVVEVHGETVAVDAPRRGHGGVAPVLERLGHITASGTTNLARAIDALLASTRRPGVLVVLSDFFDPGPVLAALRRARAAGHDLALIQVVDRDDEEPWFEGDLELVDAETGETVELTADATALEAYAARVAGLCEELRAFARTVGGTYVRARTDSSLEEAVRRFVDRSID